MTEIQDKIEQSVGGFIVALSALNDAELNTRMKEESWTPAQIADHLLKSYGIAGILKAPGDASSRPADQKVAQIREVFLNFDVKMESPEEILPAEGHINKESLLKDLDAAKKNLLDLAGTLDLTELCTVYEIPGFGTFTRLEWFHFICVHTERHHHQLEQMMILPYT